MLLVAIGAAAGGCEKMSNPVGVGAGALAAGAGCAENISESRSTSLCVAGSDFAGGAVALPFCLTGGAAPPPPPKMSSRSKRLGSPPPEGAAGFGTAASPPSSNGSIIPPSVIAPLLSSRFLCITLTSTMGIRANASFAAPMTASLTAPSPLPPVPNTSSSPPPLSALLTDTPRIASMSAPYSHDRSCSSSEWLFSYFSTSFRRRSSVASSAEPANRSRNFAKHRSPLRLGGARVTSHRGLDDVHHPSRLERHERDGHRSLGRRKLAKVGHLRDVGPARGGAVRVGLEEEVAVLPHGPDAHVEQSGLAAVVVPHGLEQAVGRVRPQVLRRARDVRRRRALDGRLALPSRDGEHGDEGVDPPPVVRPVAVHDPQHAGANVGAVVAGADDEVVEQLGREGLDVGLVDEVVDELEGALADGDVGVLEAVDDGGPVALEGRRGGVGGAFVPSFGVSVRHAVAAAAPSPVVRDAPGQGVERHVSDVVVPVQEEPPEDVDGQHPQPVVALHGHDGLHALVEDGVPCVFGRLRVGRDLRQDVVHLLGRLGVPGPEEAEEREDLHLEERVGDAPDVVLGAVAHGEEVAQELDEGGHEPGEGGAAGALLVVVLVVHAALSVLPVDDQHPGHELHDGDEHAVRSVVEQSDDALDEVLGHVRALGEAAGHGEAGLLPEVGLGADEVLVHLRREVAAHVGRGEVPDGAEREAGDEFVVRVEVVLEGVGGEHEDVGLLREEQHHAQVADALLGEVRGRHELHALQLPESNFATFRCRYCSCSSRMAVRIIADSFAITARSSAAVLHARTCRMRSRNFKDMVVVVVMLCGGKGRIYRTEGERGDGRAKAGSDAGTGFGWRGSGAEDDGRGGSAAAAIAIWVVGCTPARSSAYCRRRRQRQ
ncbi:LOW QUALITY PROTEIN: hypothetical protein ACHAWF_016403 [Thalassiosira exigua]